MATTKQWKRRCEGYRVSGRNAQPERFPQSPTAGACSETLETRICLSALTGVQVAQAAFDAGFRSSSLAYAVAIADAESRFNLSAINTSNPNGSVDRGLWQINSTHPYDPQRLLTDADFNAMAAYAISNNGANWRPWATFYPSGQYLSPNSEGDGQYTEFVNAAIVSASAVDPTVVHAIGDAIVSTTNGLNVHNLPGASPPKTEQRNAGDSGVVIGAYQLAKIGGTGKTWIWWDVRWADGEEGWSAQDFLSRTGASSSAPSINGVTPNPVIGSYGAQSLTIVGHNFASGDNVTFVGASPGSQPATVSATAVNSSELIAANVFSNDPGNWTAQVVDPAGNKSAPFGFAVNAPTPVITSLNPSAAAAGTAGLALTVSGGTFDSSSVIYFNGQPLPTSANNAGGLITGLTADIPTSNLTTVGSYPVTVLTPGPGGGMSTPYAFSVTGPTAPAVPTVSPPGGSYSGDVTVQVTLASPTPGTTMYYTLDGTTPTVASTPYSGTFTLYNSATVKAIAYDPASALSSAIATASFTINNSSQKVLALSIDQVVFADQGSPNSTFYVYNTTALTSGGMPYSLSTTDPWITIQTPSGVAYQPGASGNVASQFAVSSFAGPGGRVGTITVTAPGALNGTAVLKVIQGADPYSTVDIQAGAVWLTASPGDTTPIGNPQVGQTVYAHCDEDIASSTATQLYSIIYTDWQNGNPRPEAFQPGPFSIPGHLILTDPYPWTVLAGQNTFQFTLNDLNSPPEYNVDNNTSTLMITAADPPSVSVRGVSVLGSSVTRPMANFAVALSAPTFQPVLVNYATADGTARAGTDYTAAQGTLMFDPGQTTEVITVPVNSGAAANTSFSLNLSDANHATLGQSQADATIAAVPPALTIGIGSTVVVGAGASVPVTTNGYPAASLTEEGDLPSGITFHDNGDGTGLLSGTPAAGTGGAYSLSFSATNGVAPDATQPFTLTVAQPPAISSTNNGTFVVGSVRSFTVQTIGYPAALLGESGALPGGLNFVDNGDGTATISGTPVAGSQGTYPIALGASNAFSPDATQTFTLTVQPAALTDSQKQQLMLGMVNAHRGALPAELVLAEIFQEGGQGAFHVNGSQYNPFYSPADAPWAQPDNNGDGIMQVTVASGHHEASGPYTNDQSGYDNAIADGCAYLLEEYAAFGSLWQAVLHYNSGPHTLAVYKGLQAGDPGYLGKVASALRNLVPPMFGISNPTLAAELDAAQQIVNRYLNDPTILTGQPASYYVPYQAQLETELHNLNAVVGSVLNDLNHNGIADPNEPGLAGVTVFADLNNNGALDPAEPSAISDPGGNYSLVLTSPGMVLIRQVLPGGYAGTAPLGYADRLTTAAAQSSSAPAFGDVQISTVPMDFNYLLALAQNYNQPGTFASGDVNGDDQVNFADLLILAQNYGHSLSTPAAAAASWDSASLLLKKRKG